MTDSYSLLANQMAVSDQVLFNLKPSAEKSRSYKVSVPPCNASTFAPSTTMQFQIPCGRRNTYIDPSQSFIKYTVQNNDLSGNSFNIDNNGSCFINRLDTFHSGTLVDTCQQYSQIYTYLLDFQATHAHKTGLSNIYGCTNSVSNANTRQGLTISGGTRSTFCMPILSSLIGIGNSKSVPLGMLNIRLEFTLEQQNKAVCYAQNPSFG